ncbi:MAG: hypothetical protein HZB38_19240 [Planctomycetes bacterium]|nr:hypothetical protein [Planctomycetota bacterium]
MKLSFLGLVAGLLVAGSALAQQGGSIQWSLDLAQAVEKAKKSQLPIMMWIQGTRLDRQETVDIEGNQVRAFRDPRVASLAQRFVPVKVYYTRYKKELSELGVSENANFDLYFVTADGQKLGEMSPSGATNADSLAEKLALVFDAFRTRLYEKEAKPVLENEKAEPKAQVAALDLVSKYNIVTADSGVLALLKRGGGEGAVTKKAYEVLARLSTRPAVEELFARSVNDKRAAESLEKCTPAGAEALLVHLENREADQAKFLAAYKAVAKISKISSVKPDKFWDGKNERLKDDEAKRVIDLAKKAAARWRERFEEYR